MFWKVKGADEISERDWLVEQLYNYFNGNEPDGREWTDRQWDMYETMMLLYEDANVLPNEEPSSSLGFTRTVCEKLVDGYLEMKPDEIWFAMYKDTLRHMAPEDIRRLSVRLEILALQVANIMKEREEKGE